MLLTAGCGILPSLLNESPAQQQPVQQPAQQPAQQPSTEPAQQPVQQITPAPVSADPSGEAVILFTGNVHCAVDQGFGYAGLQQLRDYLRSRGDEVILVDNGDAVQGEPLGTMTKGEAIVSLMNQVGYEIAVPGSHDFDYGADRFLELANMANFSYISCNFNQDGQLLFAPYVTRQLGSHLVAFVGVTTPKTLTASSPLNFTNEEGKYAYSFYQDDQGRYLFSAVQKAVDNARVEGVDFVVLLGYLGSEDAYRPWTSSNVIANTSGIDLVVDGNCSDTEPVLVKNKNGEDVTRIGCGERLGSVGYCRITAGGELSVGTYSWPNEVAAPEMLRISNDMTAAVSAAKDALVTTLDQIFASTRVELTVSDPLATDIAGNPIRMINSAETNLGDLCADALRIQSGADAAIISGGDICVSIPAGDISLGDLLRVFPDGNSLCVVEVTGITIMDALEWGVRNLPDENEGFLQVSGLTYEVHTYLANSCVTDDNGNFRYVYGNRHVQNVRINGQPIALYSVYKLAGTDRLLLDLEGGFQMFKDCKVLQNRVKLDNQVLMDYIADNLNGDIGDEYENPFGQGRIVIYETAP